MVRDVKPIVFPVLLLLYVVANIVFFMSETRVAHAQSSIPAVERIAREFTELNRELKRKEIKCECHCLCPQR